MMDDQDYLAMDGLPAGLSMKARVIATKMPARQVEKVHRYVGLAKTWLALHRMEQEHA